MDVKDMTEQQLFIMKSEVETELTRRYQERVLRIERRRAHGPAFADEELMYAATLRCQCGAGMAYPKGTGKHDAWECSALLTGRATRPGQPGDIVHTGRLDFATHEITTEYRSPSGQTTRPAKGAGA